MARILIVDDEPACRDLLARYLEREGHAVLAAATAARALAESPAFAPDLVLCDWLLPGQEEGEAPRALQALLPDVPVAIMSGLAEAEVRRRAGDLQVAAVLEKRLDVQDIAARVHALVTGS